MAAGKVFLVGAGPGDPGLITLRGVDALGRADVVVYDGLANARLLEHAPDAAERIYAGKKHSEHGAPLTQAEIEDLLVERAGRGLTVVRLKGGDPFVFGRGGEEAERLVAEGIPYEVVPGVSAFSAVPAYAGIPLTHRDVASTVIALATGQEEDGAFPTDWTAAAGADTIVLFMGVDILPLVVERLVAAGKDPRTPAAAIRWGTTPQQRTVVAPLEELSAAVAAADLRPPALVVVGEVVRFRERLEWYERRPLFGKRILFPIGRDGGSFDDLASDLGAEVVSESYTIQTPLRTPLRPAGQRWLVLTSPATLESLRLGLGAAGLDLRALAGMRVAVVGHSTAQPLRGWLHVDLVPEDQSGAGLARALLAADPDLVGEAVLWPCAEKARPELLDILTAAGVRVDAVPVYRTVPIAEYPTLADFDVVVVKAPSHVEALTGALDRVRTIAALGPTTAAAAREHGLRVDVVAEQPTAEALVAALVAHFAKENR